MFGKIVGFGAQSLIADIRCPSHVIDEWLTPDMLPIHTQQVRNRGLVAKVMRTDGWEGWFRSNNMSTSASDARIISQLRYVDAEGIQMLSRCAQKIASLRSNFVVPYIRVVSTADELRILMPKYSTTLQEWSRQNRKRLDEVLLGKIAFQLALGLMDLHEEGIFHLDFHGGNVFVSNSKSDEPHCVIGDLEASYFDGISLGVSHAFTEPFAAPERSRVQRPCVKEGGPVGQALENTLGKCDVWSLGLLLYSMAADHDFPGLAEQTADLGSILMNHEKLTPTRIAAIVRRDLGESLEKIHLKPYSDGFISLITMMLNHDPLTRPSLFTVVQSLEALNEHSKSLSSSSSATLFSSAPMAQVPLPFPLSVGPYQLLRLPSTALNRVELYPGSNMYDVHGRCPRCTRLRSRSRGDRSDCSDGSLHLPSHMSPPWNDDPLLPGLVNPSRRLWMQFLFPMMGDSLVANGLLRSVTSGAGSDDSLLEQLLQVQGGFAVYDTGVGGGGDSASSPAVRLHGVYAIAPRGTVASSSSVGVDPIDSSLQLHFSAAQPWPSACTEVLRQSGRIHVEVPSLLGTTAKCFSFLRNESFLLPNNEFWTPAPYGGLVFWFEENASKPHELDRYFSICCPGLPTATTSSSTPPAFSALVGTVSAGISRYLLNGPSPATPEVSPDSAMMHGGVVAMGSLSDPSVSKPSPSVSQPSPSCALAAPTDRTPAGRLYFNELDAMTPFGIASSMMPQVVEHSPVIVSQVAHRTNLGPGPQTSVTAHPHQYHQQDESKAAGGVSAGGANNSALSSRNPSASRPSTTARTAVGSLQVSALNSREPSIIDMLKPYSKGPSLESNVRVGSDMSRVEVAQCPPSRVSSNESIRDAATRPASLESQKEHFTPPSGSMRDSQDTEPSPMPQLAAQRPPASHAGGGLDAQRFLAPQRVLPSPSLSSGGGGGSVPGANPFPDVPRQLSMNSTSTTGSSTYSTSQPRYAHQALEARVPDVPFLFGAVCYPMYHQVQLQSMSHVRRFHVVPTSERGTCGPILHIQSSTLLCIRLGISLQRHPDVTHLCFCATDAQPQPIQSTQIGPGGSVAASAYCANEKFLQHHGILLLNDALEAVGLVSLRVAYGDGGGYASAFPLPSERRPVGHEYQRIPLQFRGQVSDAMLGNIAPLGVIGEFDPFLVASSVHHAGFGSSSQFGSSSLPSPFEHVGGVQQDTLRSTAGGGVMSRKTSAAASMLELQSRKSSVLFSSTNQNHQDNLGGTMMDLRLARVPGARYIAADLHRGQFYFSDIHGKDWLEFMLL